MGINKISKEGLYSSIEEENVQIMTFILNVL